jgi:AraC family transcriptional activator of pobA
MRSSSIYIFDSFNEFHQMANGGVRAHHEDIQVFTFAEVSENTAQKTPLFKTNFYQIGLFSEVNFEVSYFGKTRPVTQKNAIVLFKPGQTISFSKANPEASGYAIMFKENFIEWRLSNSNTLKDFSILDPEYNCIFFVNDSAFQELTDIASKMYHEYQQVLLMNSEYVLQLYCQILVSKINSLNKSHIQTNTQPLYFQTTQHFKSLVFQHIHKTKTVSDYASMLYMTEKTLNNHFRETTQTSPKEFINQLIIAESKAMLLNKASVEQVAAYFNFTDQAHFSNFFRKMTGHSPSAFRKSSNRS